MLREGSGHEEEAIRARCRRRVPAGLPIGVDACDRWADGNGAWR
jgi:hypothetical protein